MLLKQGDKYIKNCMSTWLLCEACIHNEQKKLFPKEKLLVACRDCASSCLSIVSQIITNPLPPEETVFDCFLYCRECYNECKDIHEAGAQSCGENCEKCAEAMKELLVFHLN
jgi:hypothetical protein